MKHRVAGRKLGRTSAHRLALLRNLSTQLFRSERIRTTLGKAKELRPFAEKLVTLSKRETLHARRLVARHIHDRDVVAKLFDTLSARYAQRPGGYTRIMKLGPRRGDAAEMAVVELVGAETVTAAVETEAPAKTRKKRGKGREDAVAADEAAAAEAPKAKKAAKKRAAAKPPKKVSKKAAKKSATGARPKKGGKKSSGS